MKQAFTNTTNAKTKGKPLHLKSRGGQKMPICRYGAACTYQKTCIYRHPENITNNKSSKICVAFIAGKCSYGKNCNNKHLLENEIPKYKSKFNSVPCKYGIECKTVDCLYAHEVDISSGLNVYANEFVPNEEKLQLEKIPTYSMTRSNRSATKTTQVPLKKKRMPDCLWVNDFERPPNLFYMKNVMEKFAAVNEVYSRPKFAMALKSLKVRVVDLHFQTINGCKQVLKEVLPRLQLVDKNLVIGVWIITGTGHHVVKDSHQKKTIDGDSVLMSTSKSYLISQKINFEIGVDKSGQSGAIYVPLS